MDKYRDYIARTQQDRIALDTLSALEEIRNLLKTQIHNTIETTQEEIDKIVQSTSKKTSSKRSEKGDISANTNTRSKK